MTDELPKYKCGECGATFTASNACQFCNECGAEEVFDIDSEYFSEE